MSGGSEQNGARPHAVVQQLREQIVDDRREGTETVDPTGSVGCVGSVGSVASVHALPGPGDGALAERADGALRREARLIVAVTAAVVAIVTVRRWRGGRPQPKVPSASARW